MGALQDNLKRLKARLNDAERAAGRAVGSVQLLPVTKTADPALTLEFARAGELELAENRVPFLEQKAAELAAAGVQVRWHFIGHLQRNKARRVLQLAEVIHSVDSLRLIETLARIAEEEKLRPRIFLEVLMSSEKEKSGFDPADLKPAIEAVVAAQCFDLEGIMVMGPRNPDGTQQVFQRANILAQRLSEAFPDAFSKDHCQLSMGMSGDLELAVAAGSHVVRVGSALFEGLESLGSSALKDPKNASEGAA